MIWLWTKRILHGLMWIWLSLAAASVPATLIGGTLSDTSTIAAGIGFAVLLVGATVLSIYAIRGGWSLKWPLIVMLCFACLMIGTGGIPIIATIGLIKLAIWWIGRGRTVAASRLREPVRSARPCGLVEYITND